jgi:inner membrane protein
VDPVTHTLTSIALGRAGLNKITRAAIPMLLVSGVVADADWISRLGGADAFFRGHRTATHSLIGTVLIVTAVAVAALFLGRKCPKFSVRILPALAICAAGAGAHVVLDLLNSYGVKLLWPFRQKWYALDLVPEVDWWILLFLSAGLLGPELFRMVHEEIGEKTKGRGRERGAIVALVLCGLWIGARGLAHERAVALLDSRDYRGQSALMVAAFPQPWNPLLWSGVVETDSTIINLEVPLVPVRAFDPETGSVHFKPQPSSALANAVASPAALEFLNFARFPIAGVQREGDGFLVRLRDLRFASGLPLAGDFAAVIRENAEQQVISSAVEFASVDRR